MLKPPSYLCVAMIIIAASTQLRAQDSLPVNRVAQAVTLRDSGQLASAAGLLKEVLASEPANGEAARLLAQTLYWMKDVRGASAAYESAIRIHTDDVALRLDYAQMLMETQSNSRALEILQPLLRSPFARARAETLVGTMQYWGGDLASAASSFERALSYDSTNVEARRQLNEIRAISRPWMSIEPSGLTDDQPVTRSGGNVEAGWFINPLATLSVRLSPMHFTIADTATANVVSGAVGVSHYAPSAHLETGLSAGIVYSSGTESSTDWIGRGSLRFRLPNHLFIGASAARAPYLWTIASLLNPVMYETGSIIASLDNPKGWLAESGASVQRFPDDNSVNAFYAWGMAPIIRANEVKVSGGYAFAVQDAGETRFALRRPTQAVPPTSPQFDLSGRYDPYYTPEGFRAHSAIGSISISASPRTTFTARGSYAFHAIEDAPRFIAVVGAPSSNPIQLTFDRRTFHPWDAHLNVSSALSDAVTIAAAVDRTQTAFYTATTAALKLSWTVRRSPARRGN